MEWTKEEIIQQYRDKKIKRLEHLFHLFREELISMIKKGYTNEMLMRFVQDKTGLEFKFINFYRSLVNYKKKYLTNLDDRTGKLKSVKNNTIVSNTEYPNNPKIETDTIAPKNKKIDLSHIKTDIKFSEPKKHENPFENIRRPEK